MNIYFFYEPSRVPLAQKAFDALTEKYGQIKDPADADAVVVIGGDGTLMRAVRAYGIPYNKKTLGINFGEVGFLLNPYNAAEDLKNLPERINAAEKFMLHPLSFKAEFEDDVIETGLAINDFQLRNRSLVMDANYRVCVDGLEKAAKVKGDGVIIATSVGSTAYNYKAKGIVPQSFDNDNIFLTPNNATGILPQEVSSKSSIVVEVLGNHLWRKVASGFDSVELEKECLRVEISKALDCPYTLLFDPGSMQKKRAPYLSSSPKVG